MVKDGLGGFSIQMMMKSQWKCYGSNVHFPTISSASRIIRLFSGDLRCEPNVERKRRVGRLECLRS